MEKLGIEPLLDEGVSTWNVWRRNHPDALPELREAMLTGWYLRGIDVRTMNRVDVPLNRWVLIGAYLSLADFYGASVVKADPSRAPSSRLIARPVPGCSGRCRGSAGCPP